LRLTWTQEIMKHRNRKNAANLEASVLRWLTVHVRVRAHTDTLTREGGCEQTRQ